MPAVNPGPAISSFPNTVAGYVANTSTQPPATYTTDSLGNVTGLSGTVTTASGQSSQQFFSPFVATHTASIDARTMPSGAVTAATSGVLRTIAGAAASLINISGGAITLPPTTNGNSAYISLQCDDTVQYMRAILSYPSVCTGGFTMIIPYASGNFPGTGNTTGSGDAGVHAGLVCWTGSANETNFSAGGYGPNAGAITGYGGQDVSATIPLQGHTVTVELFCNKYSGRVTLAINNDIVGDYTDLRTISYLGPYAVFELGASTTNGNNPSIILMEASSQYIQPAVGLVPKAYANYPGSVVNMTSSLTSLFTAQAASGAPNGCAALVIASVFITQASGDCQMRLYDGASGYSGTQVVARGAFTGRVTYIQSFIPSTTSPAPNVQVQIANTAGVGTVNQGSDTNVDYVIVLPIPHYQI